MDLMFVVDTFFGKMGQPVFVYFIVDFILWFFAFAACCVGGVRNCMQVQLFGLNLRSR